MSLNGQLVKLHYDTCIMFDVIIITKNISVNIEKKDTFFWLPFFGSVIS